MSCDHMNTMLDANVSNVKTSDDGPVVGTNVSLKLRCMDCNKSFLWQGVHAIGREHSKVATVSGDRLTLNVPVAIEGTVKSPLDMLVSKTATKN